MHFTLTLTLKPPLSPTTWSSQKSRTQTITTNELDPRRWDVLGELGKEVQTFLAPGTRLLAHDSTDTDEPP